MSSTTKKLRACMLCSLVQTPSEFRKDGCPNCAPLGVSDTEEQDSKRARSACFPTQMKGDKDRVLECTTSAFDGLIAMVKPEDSWVVGSLYAQRHAW
jgi:transcription elongation factor SPT4